MNQTAPRKTGDAVQIHGKSVFRSVISDVIEETLKLNTIADCGSRYKFLAPSAKVVSPSKIEMVFLPTHQSASEIYRAYVCSPAMTSRERCTEFVESCGRALANIHKSLSAAHVVSQVRRIERNSNECVLHCDFGFSNIFLNANSELVIFDPFPDFYSTFETWETGKRTVDLGMFVSCLVGRVPPRDFLQIRIRRITELIKLFVDTYNLEASSAESIDDILTQSKKIARSYFLKNRTGIKGLVGFRLWSRNFVKVRQTLGSK